MGLEDQAERRVRDALADVGFVSGGEFYLAAAAVQRFLEACQGELLAVIGIEGFTLLDGKLMPDLDLIADFSSFLRADGTWEVLVRQTMHEARLFVGHIPPRPDRWLNFTLVSEAARR